MARRSGAKRIFKSKRAKDHTPGTIFEVPNWKNCTPLWREAHCQVMSSQNVQNTSGTEQFLKWPPEKIARRCDAKRICNSKYAKHLSFGAILEVPTSKNCTPLWRETHFQFKMWKNLWVRATFGRSDVQKWHAAVARSTFFLQVKKYKAPAFSQTFGPSDVEKVSDRRDK